METTQTVWCPYTDREFEASGSTLEHIIPLSLGGSNAFVTPVDSGVNSTVGLEIDGPLANDFGILLRRQRFNARGHSGKPPEAIIRKAKHGLSQRPVQVSFLGGKGLRVWDAIDRRDLDEHEIGGVALSLQLKVDWFVRLRFLAKVALSSGYFLFRDIFRRSVDHQGLRALMLAKTSDEAMTTLKHSGLRGYFEFAGISKVDLEVVELEKGECEAVQGSCVIVRFGPCNIAITVGILGRWIGTLNIPAQLEKFPLHDDDYDLGHAVLLVAGTMRRLSYRHFAQQLLDVLDRQRHTPTD